jgi:hypothetical protein
LPLPLINNNTFVKAVLAKDNVFGFQEFDLPLEIAVSHFSNKG